MPQHYAWRKDLSKYTLKSFDSANEFVCDTNNSDALTVNKNGTQAVLQDSVSASASSSPIEIIGATSAGGATSAYTLVKTVTGIADDTATTIFTITIPNPGTGLFSSAVVNVSLLGICGAGGSIGAGEFITTAVGSIGVTRTPGVASVINISSLTQTTAVNVAGGDTAVAITLTNVAVSGGNTATQTFAIQVTIDDDTASGTNHICTFEATVINSAASGVTIA